MDYLKELQSALVDPLSKDWKNAYRMQRVARSRYPAMDAVLNFIPYIGAVTNIDDAISNTNSGQYGDVPADLAGLFVNLGLAKTGFKGLKTVADTIGNSSKNKQNILGVAAGGIGATYLDHYIEQQQKANAQYKDQTLLDIFKEKYGDVY